MLAELGDPEPSICTDETVLSLSRSQKRVYKHADDSILRQGHWAAWSGCGQILLREWFKRAERYQNSTYSIFLHEGFLDEVGCLVIMRLLVATICQFLLVTTSMQKDSHHRTVLVVLRKCPMFRDAPFVQLHATSLHLTSLHFIWACDFALAAAEQIA